MGLPALVGTWAYCCFDDGTAGDDRADDDGNLDEEGKWTKKKGEEEDTTHELADEDKEPGDNAGTHDDGSKGSSGWEGKKESSGLSKAEVPEVGLFLESAVWAGMSAVCCGFV